MSFKPAVATTRSTAISKKPKKTVKPPAIDRSPGAGIVSLQQAAGNRAVEQGVMAPFLVGSPETGWRTPAANETAQSRPDRWPAGAATEPQRVVDSTQQNAPAGDQPELGLRAHGQMPTISTAFGLMKTPHVALRETIEFPSWVPEDIREKITKGQFQPGVYRVPYSWPEGFQSHLIIWVSEPGLGASVQFLREYPINLEFYLLRTNGDERAAKILQEKYIARDRNIRRYVGVDDPFLLEGSEPFDRGNYTPELAEEEMEWEEQEEFKAKMGGFATILGLGSAISSMSSSLRQAPIEGQRLSPSTGVTSAAPVPKAVPARATSSAAKPSFMSRLSAKLPKLFHKPTWTADPSLPPGSGSTGPFGDVRYSTQGSAADQALVKAHEAVHSRLSPKFLPLQQFRADVSMKLYGIPNYNLARGQAKVGSSFMRYLEEALAESYAQYKVHGITKLPSGITFPVREGYVALRDVVTEAAIGTVAVGGITYGVYVYASEEEVQEPEPRSGESNP